MEGEDLFNSAENSIGNLDNLQLCEETRTKDFLLGQTNLIDTLSSSDVYKEKIEEFKIALYQRDMVIGQLEKRLEECMYERDQIVEDTKEKSIEFTREIEILQVKLKESISLLQNKTTGVSLVEHVELKNKLIEMQQDRLQEKEDFEALQKELKTEHLAGKEFEQKYKLMINLHKDVKEKHRLEYAEREDMWQQQLNQLLANHQHEIEEREAQKMIQEKRYLEEQKEYKEELNEVKKQNKFLVEKINEDKSNFESKIQELIFQVEEHNQRIDHLNSEKENYVAENNKSMEILIVNLSEKHNNELEELKNKHRSEITLISEQIDFLEKNQKEEESKTMENLKEIYNVGQKYKKELEEERIKNGILLAEIDELKLKFTNIDSKSTLLEKELTSEKEQMQIKVQDLNNLMKENLSLKDKILQLECDMKLFHENEQRKNDEYSLVTEQLEREKELKNEMNLKIQELNTQNEHLVNELESMNKKKTLILQENKHRETQIKDLGTELKRERKEREIEKGVSEAENVELKNQIRNCDDEKKNFINIISDLQIKISENMDMETKVESLSQKVQSLRCSVADLQKYKDECHDLNEKIVQLYQVLSEKESCSSDDDEVMRACSLISDSSDPFSLLAAQVTLISSKLDETDYITSEFHAVLQEKDLYKEELDRLNLKLKENSELEDKKLEFRDRSVEDVNMDKVQSMNEDNITKGICVSCQTLVSTRDQGFQTSLSGNSTKLLATKTIEEDYLIEEILVVPKTLSLKGSISLKNLREIGAAESAANSSLVSGTVPADYEQLKSKYHESQYVIKALESENSHLRRALQFKKSVSLKSELGEENMIYDKEPIGKIENILDEKEDAKEVKTSTCNDTSNYTRETVKENIRLPKNKEVILDQIKILDQELQQLKQNEENQTEFLLDTDLASTITDSLTQDNTNKPTKNEDPIYCEDITPRNDDDDDDTQDTCDELTLKMKFGIQRQLNESLREELKTKFISNSDADNWQHHLERAVELFVETQHPYFQRKSELVSGVIERWTLALEEEEKGKREDGSRGEKEKEEDGGKGRVEEDKEARRPTLAVFDDLLDGVKRIVIEQKEFQKMLKDIENKIILHMENNLQQVIHEMSKENSLNFVLRDVNASVCKSGSLVEEAESDILREFQDITSSIMDRTQEEKMRLLQNQRTMLKILEENQSRISDIFNKHLKNLQDVSGEDIENLLGTVAEKIDSSLNEESIMVEKMYGELLKQYSHEQYLHSETHSLTLNEFKLRISAFLQQHKCQVSV